MTAGDSKATDDQTEDPTGLGLKFGTVEEARKLIGNSSEPRFGETEINQAMIQYYCSAMQDGNPSYWSAEFAEKYWGGITSPPGMLQTWLIPYQWRPEGRQYMSSMLLETPLPGDKPINVSTEFEYFRHVHVGDRLNMSDRLVDISGEKTTRVGTGHFITTIADYRNQRGNWSRAAPRSSSAIVPRRPHDARNAELQTDHLVRGE